MSEEVQVDAQAQTTEGGIGLGLQDIANAVRVIDVCSSRGAVQGDELSSVGQVRDRLVAFLNAHQPPAQEETPTPPEGKDVSESVEDATEVEVDVTEG